MQDILETDEQWMQLALRLAEQAAELGEVPVGAVIVSGDGKLISTGYNRREIDENSLAHAEIIAIDAACRRFSSWRLENSTLYVTLEPCPMCAGAIINSRISRVVFAASDPKSGCFGSLLSLQDVAFNHKPEIIDGVLKQQSSRMLKEFFAKLRAR